MAMRERVRYLYNIPDTFALRENLVDFFQAAICCFWEEQV